VTVLRHGAAYGARVTGEGTQDALAGLHAGVPGWRLAAAAGAAAILGGIIAVLLYSLHGH
jgi:hypothetical protein